MGTWRKITLELIKEVKKKSDGQVDIPAEVAVGGVGAEGSWGESSEASENGNSVEKILNVNQFLYWKKIQ